MNNNADKYLTVTVLDEIIQFRYWDIGEGRPIILVHGVAGCLEIWSKNIVLLSQHFRVIVVDMIGHGQTTRLKDVARYTTDYMAHALLAFLKALGIPAPYTLIGHSAGGIICLKIATQHPDMLNQLILFAPGGIGKDIGKKFRIATVYPLGEIGFSAIGLKIGKLFALARLPKNELIDKNFVSTLFGYLAMPKSGTAVVYSLRNEANLSGLKPSSVYSREELGGITANVLLFWGSRDNSIPAKYIQPALAYIPNSRGIIFQGAGHRSQVSQSEIANNLILQFLKDGRLNDDIEQKASQHEAKWI